MAPPKTATKYDIVSWRAWYTGERKYNSETTKWEDLPAEGVLCFVFYQREKKRRRLMAGVTLYWNDGEIFAGDNVADAEIRSNLPQEFIKRGKWVTDAEFGKAYDEASAIRQSPNESVRI